MNVSRNGYPIEEGTWTRRSGTRFLAPSFKGQPAKVYPLYFTESAPYEVEFTDSNIRFFNSNWPVITAEIPALASLSTDDPAVFTLVSPVAWSTGDEILFFFSPSVSGLIGEKLRQRTFLITAIPETYAAWDDTVTYGSGAIVTYSGVTYLSIQAGNLNEEPDTNAAFWTPLPAGVTRTYSIKDAVTGVNFDGSTTSLAGAPTLGVSVLRLLRVATPYAAGAWENARIVQNEDIAVILNGVNKPQALTVTPNEGSNQVAAATIQNLVFKDGPYLNSIPNSIATLGGLSGNVSLSIDFQAYDSTVTYGYGDYVKSGSSAYKSLVGNNLNHTPVSSPTYWEAHDRGTAVTGPGYTGIAGFQATDVGRLVRLLSEPALWVSGGYVTGDIVKFNNLYYQAVNNNSAEEPDLFPGDWTVSSTAALWTWGQITAITNSNSCSIDILGPAALYALPVVTWRLGVYSDTTGYPTCGLFHEGRFWFGGAAPNRFDASMVDGITKDGIAIMSPTGPGANNVSVLSGVIDDGTVTDANAISYKLEAHDQNPILWFAPDHLGVIVGTGGGEWLLSASQLSDPLTPTSIQAKQVTRYKCADIEPRRTGISLVFVQKFKRRVMEFLSDVFTGRFVAPHLSETAKHLTQNVVEDIAYQEELAPILWARIGDGSLVGATYRRVSAFTTEAPAFVGWHRHDLGTGRNVESIGIGPSSDGTLDSLTMVTNDPTLATPVRWVEAMTQMFDEDDTLYNAWFLDGGVVPDQFTPDTVTGVNGMRLTGLYYLSGQTLTVFIGGLDVGDFTVDSDGTIFVPFGSGIPPASFDYTAAGAGAYLFTQTYVNAVLAQNLAVRNGAISSAGAQTITTTTVATNPNPTSLIQSFLPNTDFSSVIGATDIAVDWSNGRVAFSGSSSNVSAFRVFTIANGTEIADATTDTITGGSGTSGNDAYTFDTAGHLYFGWGGGSTYQKLGVANGVDLSLDYVYGTASNGGSGPPSVPGIVKPSAMMIIEANAKWLVCVSSGHITVNRATDGAFIAGNNSSDPIYEGLSGKPWIFLADSLDDAVLLAKGSSSHGNNVASGYMATTYTPASVTEIDLYFIGLADGVPAGNDPFLTPGGVSKAPGIAGILGFKKAYAASLGITPSVDTPITDFAPVGTIHGTDINPTWVKGCTLQSLWVDQSDNSMIVNAAAQQTGMTAYSGATTYALGDVVVSGAIIFKSLQAANLNHTPVSSPIFWQAQPNNYLVKATTGLYSRNNSGTFGVAWVVPIVSDEIRRVSMSQSNLQGGLLGFFSASTDGSGVAVFYLVDTTNGKYSALDVPGITYASNGQVWDDQTQSIIFFGSYDSTKSGAPTGVNGTVSGSNHWWRLWVGTDLVLSNTIGSTTNTKPTGYTFVTVTTTIGGLPCVVGKTFTSQGQILRAIAPDQSGTRLGPAFGTKRRSNLATGLFHNTIGVVWGTLFSKMFPAAYKILDTGHLYTPTEMYSGMYRDTISSDHDFDSQLCWQITRPYPCSVVAIGAKVESEDV